MEDMAAGMVGSDTADTAATAVDLVDTVVASSLEGHRAVSDMAGSTALAGVLEGVGLVAAECAVVG
jgi:hypothetical protein